MSDCKITCRACDHHTVDYKEDRGDHRLISFPQSICTRDRYRPHDISVWELDEAPRWCPLKYQQKKKAP